MERNSFGVCPLELLEFLSCSFIIIVAATAVVIYHLQAFLLLCFKKYTHVLKENRPSWDP